MSLLVYYHLTAFVQEIANCGEIQNTILTLAAIKYWTFYRAAWNADAV